MTYWFFPNLRLYDSPKSKSSDSSMPDIYLSTTKMTTWLKTTL